jgi:thioredoxin 1
MLPYARPVATLAVTESSFAELADAPGLTILDFWAGWCGPCLRFAPIFETVSAHYPDVTFGKVDTEAEPALAAAFGVQSIPTLVVIRDGVLLLQQAGALPEHVLDNLVREALALDMDAVRATLPTDTPS